MDTSKRRKVTNPKMSITSWAVSLMVTGMPAPLRVRPPRTRYLAATSTSQTVADRAPSRKTASIGTEMLHIKPETGNPPRAVVTTSTMP